MKIKNACIPSDGYWHSFLILMSSEEIDNLLKLFCIVRFNDNLVKVSIDGSSSEYVLDCSPHSFEDVVLSVQVNRNVSAGVFGVILVCRDNELMAGVTTLADE